jgi:cardiolipin synthase
MDASLWTGLSFSIVVVLVLVIWSIKRVRAPMLNIECDYPIDELIPSLSGLTLGTAVPGNSVQVHENGAFFDVLVERIRAARCSVHFETFLCAWPTPCRPRPATACRCG